MKVVLECDALMTWKSYLEVMLIAFIARGLLIVLGDPKPSWGRMILLAMLVRIVLDVWDGTAGRKWKEWKAQRRAALKNQQVKGVQGG